MVLPVLYIKVYSTRIIYPGPCNRVGGLDRNGIIVADRVVIDHNGDPVFYDCLIVGRDKNDELNISYEPIVNVDDKVVEYIIILGIEELKI